MMSTGSDSTQTYGGGVNDLAPTLAAIRAILAHLYQGNAGSPLSGFASAAQTHMDPAFAPQRMGALQTLIRMQQQAQMAPNPLSQRLDSLTAQYKAIGDPNVEQNNPNVTRMGRFQ